MIHCLYWRVKVGPILLVDEKLAKIGYLRDTKTTIIEKWRNADHIFWIAHPRQYLGLDIDG